MFLGSLLFVTVGCKTPITFPTHIAFPSDRDGVNQIYMMKSDGTELNRITQDVFNVEQPALSPLGLKVAFRSTKNGSSEIWSILTDGSGLTQLTHLQSVANGRWSPNGDLIAFSASPANFTAPDVYIMRNDGSRQTRLTDNPSNDAESSFSPDGKKIAFWSRREGDGDIFIMNVDGTGQVNLTHSPGLDFEPIFSPDTDEIAFRSDRDGNPEIYVMNADGTHVRRLTDNPGVDRAPDWK